MKRVVSLILCLTLIFALSVTAFAFNSPEGGNIPMKATENVNFRSGPGTNYDSYGVLNAGERFYAQNDDYDPWYAGYPGTTTNLYKYYGTIKGYVHSNYLGPI